MHSSESKLVSDMGLPGGRLSVEHYVHIVWHRRWFVAVIFVLVSVGTGVFSHFMPDVYTSETVILVDPQQVPPDYIRPTVSGNVRNRLGTLSQQILSTTRLEKIIDKYQLYAEERNSLSREDVINRMRKDIDVSFVNRGGGEDLQGFRIGYNGFDARVVAQVTNELASLFIEENLKARERMATGTVDFIAEQLAQTKRTLEEQETKLRDYRLKHVGEMPEERETNLQILSQLQARLQNAVEAQGRAEQQRSYLQALMSAQESAAAQLSRERESEGAAPRKAESFAQEARIEDDPTFAALVARYGENHPDVVRFKREFEESRRLAQQKQDETARNQAEAAEAMKNTVRSQAGTVAPRQSEVLLGQITSLDAEIVRYKEEQQRLSKSMVAYQAKVEAVPIRQQEITDLTRDYQTSKEHYTELLSKKLAAEQATQLEVRQQGEKFTILDPAQVAEKPSKPNRPVFIVAGCFGGLGLGIVLALITQLLGVSITMPDQLFAATGVAVLGIIPIIRTEADRVRRRRWVIAGAASGFVMVLIVAAALVYRYRTQIF